MKIIDKLKIHNLRRYAVMVSPSLAKELNHKQELRKQEKINIKNNITFVKIIKKIYKLTEKTYEKQLLIKEELNENVIHQLENCGFVVKNKIYREPKFHGGWNLKDGFIIKW